LYYMLKYVIITITMRRILRSEIPPAPHDALTMPPEVRARFASLSSELPTMDSLPDLRDLAKLSDANSMFRVTGDIPIGEVHALLEESDDATPEIGVNVFDDGQHILQIGTPDGLPEMRGWSRSQDFSLVDLHTHPGNAINGMHLEHPTSQDLRYLNARQGLTLVASKNSITEVPKFETNTDVDDLWTRYVAARGFDKAAYEQYGAARVWNEYMQDVIQPRMIGWRALNHTLAVSELRIAFQ
jgi:hypothetical protein